MVGGDSLGVTGGDELDVAAALRLPAGPAAAGRARRFITQFCGAADLPAELCQTAALLVSELVTNAVVHGRTAATIQVHRPVDVLRVTVQDNSPDLARVGNHPQLTEEHGCGLMIVSTLASNWGIESIDGGKAVWFELRVRG